MAKRPKEGGPSFPLGNRVQRLCWIAAWLLFASWTPRQAHRWRRFLLVAFGATMGANADVRGSAKVWLPRNLVMGRNAVVGPRAEIYNQGRIVIGDDSLISQDAYLCAGTHDFESSDFGLVPKGIIVGSHVWVCAKAFVGPGAEIEDGCIVGGGAVAFGRLESWWVYIGNPAQKKKKREWRPNATS